MPLFLIPLFLSLYQSSANYDYSSTYPPCIKNTFPQRYLDQNIGDKCFTSGYGGPSYEGYAEYNSQGYYGRGYKGSSGYEGDDKYKYTYEPCQEGALYRTYDGSCNNLQRPWWGMTYSPLVRLFPASYGDGKSSARLSAVGAALPNARLLRTKLLLSKRGLDDIRYWTYFISWSQFISHDTGHSAPRKEKLDCCASDYNSDAEMCMPILIEKDPFYTNNSVSCLNMVRGLQTKDLGCDLEPVQQAIDVTHYIDGSTVYGSTKKIGEKLRLFRGGLLKVQNINGKEFPPNYGRPRSHCDVQPHEPAVCYFAGDKRVNQNPFLTPTQVIFLRLHNTFVREVAKINPHWDDERLYQEARKAIIGIIQWITYEELLPILIGRERMKENGLNTEKSDVYKDYVNPATLNEFQTAAYRSLHGTIPGQVWMIAKTGKAAQINLAKWTHRPSVVQGYFDHLLEGMQTQFIQPQEDKWEDFDIQNRLKPNTEPYKYDPAGEDLTTLSIQRQRDYGMPCYNKFRQYSGLKTVETFEELNDAIGPEYIPMLKSSYKNVDDIDLFIGGYLEKPLPNSLFGPTFTNIIADQFYRWKYGDRFFFSFLGKPWSFTEAQYKEILKTSTGWLFCEAGDNFQWVHKNNINNLILGNQLLTPCGLLPKFDYSKWADPSYSYSEKPKVSKLFGFGK